MRKGKCYEEKKRPSFLALSEGNEKKDKTISDRVISFHGTKMKKKGPPCKKRLRYMGEGGGTGEKKEGGTCQKSPRSPGGREKKKKSGIN